MLPTEELRPVFGILPNTEVQYYLCAEDGEPYDACLVQTEDGARVIKRAKGHEASIYRTLLCSCPGVPKLYGSTQIGKDTYLCLECVPGSAAMHLDRDALTKILDALIDMQDKYWQADAPADLTYTFEVALASRKRRGDYLCDAEIERAYATYLDLFCTLPRTLCHDDLLPFNALVSDQGAALIDWEVAGMLPYPTPLARLLAHTEDAPDAFFFATEADKAFAARYYYDRLPAKHGIPFADFARALRYFTLYEYSEWIMLGNKYGNTDTPRFANDLSLARHLLPTLDKSDLEVTHHEPKL